MATSSAKERILVLLLAHVGTEVSRESIQSAADISEWARRVRELSQEGWQIETTSSGYRLLSATQDETRIKRANISSKLRYTVLRRDKSRCRRCGRTVEDGVKLVVDHIIPVDWNGPTEEGNLWTLCEQCNLGKKAYESDADAEAMKQVFSIRGARERIRAYFRLKPGQVVTREEIQIVSGISEYARRIRELRNDEGMMIEVADPRGDYIYKP